MIKHLLFYTTQIIALIFYIPSLILWILFTMCARMMLLFSGYPYLSWSFLDIHCVSEETLNKTEMESSNGTEKTNDSIL